MRGRRLASPGPFPAPSSLAAVTGLLFALASGGAPATPSTRSVLVELDASTSTPAGPGLEVGELEVRVGGEPRPVVAIHPPPAAGDERPWHLLLYFDTPLLTPEGLAEGVEELSRQADELAGLGEVSIVVADPEPRPISIGGRETTRHPHEIREALRLFAERSTLAGELLWRRLRYLEAARGADRGPVDARGQMAEERRLLEQQSEALLSWLRTAAGEPPGDGGPGAPERLLILVQDGFDLDLERFYLARTEELGDPRQGFAATHERLVRQVAAAGWTTLGLALGERGSEFSRPTEPLRRLTTATGGELLSRPGELAAALDRLRRRLRVDFVLAGVSEPAPLEVRFRGRKLRAAEWAAAPGATSPAQEAAAREPEPRPGDAVAAPAVVRLVPPGPGPHTGELRATAVTGEHEVDYVAFFLDDFLVDVDRRPPFEARIELGEEAIPRTLRAAAFSPEALPLGEDELVLNRPERPFRVSIVDVRGDPGRGFVDLDAEVSVPAGRRLAAVDFYWNEELRETLEEGPYCVRLETREPASTDYYRVVARLDDGTSLETARMVSAPGIPDRLDVNLVEIYAFVSERDHAAPAVLAPEDFEVFQGENSRTIQGFARAEEVPLTLGLAVDASSSMDRWLDDVRNAAAGFFERTLTAGDRAFLVDFRERPRLAQPVTGDVERLVRRMGGLRSEGHTALYDAMLFSLLQFEGLGGRKALVVLTDGEDSHSRFRAERCLDEALRLGVPIYLLVLEEGGPRRDVIARMVNDRLARQSGGRSYYFSDARELMEIYARIRADLASQYVLTYATEEPLSRRELADIRVEVRDPRLSVRTVLGSSLR